MPKELTPYLSATDNSLVSLKTARKSLAIVDQTKHDEANPKGPNPFIMYFVNGLYRAEEGCSQTL